MSFTINSRIRPGIVNAISYYLPLSLSLTFPVQYNSGHGDPRRSSRQRPNSYTRTPPHSRRHTRSSLLSRPFQLMPSFAGIAVRYPLVPMIAD